MSSRATTWVWTVKGITSAVRCVLLSLAESADKEGICWPGSKHIGTDCEITQSTVWRHISTLEARELITREVRYTSRPGSREKTSNLYRLAMTPQVVYEGDGKGLTVVVDQIPVPEAVYAIQIYDGAPDDVDSLGIVVKRDNVIAYPLQPYSADAITGTVSEPSVNPPSEEGEAPVQISDADCIVTVPYTPPEQGMESINRQDLFNQIADAGPEQGQLANGTWPDWYALAYGRKGFTWSYEAALAWLIANGITHEGKGSQAERAADYIRTRTKKTADWNAQFRSSCRKQVEWDEERAAKMKGTTGPTTWDQGTAEEQDARYQAQADKESERR